MLKPVTSTPKNLWPRKPPTIAPIIPRTIDPTIPPCELGEMKLAIPPAIRPKTIQ